ncbi:hypothetical protein [Rickettsia sp. TH2014]|uniref:hypothetical protein n=1 Tax=Rickettsia sp. TH2014 TaxID=1967503 RepID=UPI001C463C97|nr:hypothetical protein [Rickettsia sp. TH2014]
MIKKFEIEVRNIIDFVTQDEIYKKIYTTTARHGNGYSVVQHFKWEHGLIYELGIVANEDEKRTIKEKYLSAINEHDKQIIKYINDIEINFLYPNEPFPDSPSFSASFITNIGGNNFANL